MSATTWAFSQTLVTSCLRRLQVRLRVSLLQSYPSCSSSVSHLARHCALTPVFADNNSNASVLGSDGSCHQAHFPDIVYEEQQKAEGVNHVLTCWNNRAGVPASNLPSSLLAPLMRLQRSFVLSDPNQHDCPIVHASTAFLLMTGYPRWVHNVGTALTGNTSGLCAVQCQLIELLHHSTSHAYAICCMQFNLEYTP